mmetsp:Transcript_64165/g.153246  ORF Transcript_64165/g.153246 Transcript_64165/m.153246 type:complete len:198 (+) Transcript_64165:129-722(+)
MRWHTTFQQVAVAQEAKNLEKFLDDLEIFHNSFETFKRGGQGLPPVPENLVSQWNNLHEAKDRLEKVHDYVMKCQNMEEELVGPRPEWGHTDNATKLMENSVSARINKVVRSSSDLSAACDKVLHMIGSPMEAGIGAEVHGVVESLDEATHKLHDLTFGKADEEEAGPAAQQALAPLLLSVPSWRRPAARGCGRDFL